ncbi:hypothetical protein K1719_022610 [Acacia pycnantha]|nr:hypothetical protein K1719_022610 [Acacia pycnantha]
MVKYWDVDNVKLLESTKADGELLENPCMCFNRDGRLMAIAARENKIKILAPDYDDFWSIFKICELSQCQFLQLPIHQSVNKFMTNDRENVRPEDDLVNACCFAISNNGFNLISASGGSISLFNMETFEVLQKPKGNSAIVTSLAFSNTLYVLVHAEGDNMINFLVVQYSHLAIYEAEGLTLVKKWIPLPPLPISQADFSSDGTEKYAGFVDGTIKILDASNLQPLCRVDPTAYIPLPPTSSNRKYLVALAANPVKAGQFAVGLSDGKVYVMEPPEAKLKWSTLVRDDDKEAAGTSGVGDAN